MARKIWPPSQRGCQRSLRSNLTTELQMALGRQGLCWTVMQGRSALPCGRLLMRRYSLAADHNTLCRTGPSQKHAVLAALAQMGCPDFRGDRLVASSVLGPPIPRVRNGTVGERLVLVAPNQRGQLSLLAKFDCLIRNTTAEAFLPGSLSFPPRRRADEISAS